MPPNLLARLGRLSPRQHKRGDTGEPVAPATAAGSTAVTEGAIAGADTTRLSRAVTGMAVGTVLSRITGFGRVLALAYAVGFTRLTDTYNLANTAPNIVYELVLGGVLSASLVPVFVDRLTRSVEGDKQKNDEAATRAISAVVTMILAVLVALTVALVLAAPAVIRIFTLRLSGEEAAAQQAVGTMLLRLFAPQVFFYGLITVITALLNARRRFVAPMATPVLNNLIVIAVLLTLPHVLDANTLGALRANRGALLLLGLGTTAGVVVQAFALFPFLRAAQVRLRLVWAPGHEAVRAVLGLAAWTIGVVVTNQATLGLVLFLANGRDGDVAAYQAAYQFFLLPHAVVAVSIMTALLPDLAERWSAGDRAGYGARLSHGLAVTVLVLLPAAVGYALLARPIVGLALEHGALSAASARTTGEVLALFALGLPFFSSYLLLMRAYQAMANTRSMFVAYCIENGLNVALAFVFYPLLGVQGLALAFTLAYAGGTAVAVADVGKRVGGLDAGLAASVARMVAATVVMAAGVTLVSRAMGENSGVVVQVGVGVAVGVSLYLLASRALGLDTCSVTLARRWAGHRPD